MVMIRKVGKRRGFTLIELLVVIAIIAILAAILFPVFIRAKEFSRVSVCISNLKQIGHGIQMYCDDNQGRFPAMVGWGRADATATAMGYRLQVDVLAKYTRTSVVRENNASNPNKWFASVGVFRCPDDFGFPQDIGVMAGCKPKPSSVWEQCGSSYDYVCEDQPNWQNAQPPEMTNGKGGTVKYSGLSPAIRDASGQWRCMGAPVSAIRNPSKKGILSDMWNWHASESNTAGYEAHRNTLFADGHATRTWWRQWGPCRALPLAAWFDSSQKY